MHSVSLSTLPEKCSRYHPRTARVPFLSSQRPFPVPLGYSQKKGLKRCSTGKKNSQILFSLASFLLMSSYSCKRMSRDQNSKATESSGLSFGRYKEVPQIVYTCTKRRTHADTHTHKHARTHARTHGRTHVHTHTHTRLHYFQLLSVSQSTLPEKCSRYHPRTALVPFLSSQRPFPVPLEYSPKKWH